MPFYTFDTTLSGSGSDSIGANRVYYFLWRVTVEGHRVRRAIESDADGLNGVGYVSFGNAVDGVSDFTGDAWSEQHWLNYRQGQIIAPPNDLGGAFGRFIAERIHWSLSEGTEIRCIILADTL